MTVDQEVCGEDQEEDNDDDYESEAEPDNFTQLLEVCGQGGLTRSRVGSRRPRSTSVLGSLRRFIKKEIQKRKQRLGHGHSHLPRAQERSLASVANLSFGSGHHRDPKLLFGQ